MSQDLLVVLLGIAVVGALAHWVVRASVTVAQRAGWSHTLVGLTVLSIGTSMPEIVAHVAGSVRIIAEPALRDSISALVIGNNIGSDVFQQNFALPAVGLIAAVGVQRHNLMMQAGALVGAAVLFWGLAIGGFSRVEGALLIVAYGAYLVAARRWRWDLVDTEPSDPDGRGVAAALLGIAVGLLLMGAAADRVLVAATALVERLAISASLFGVLVLGTASALPELLTSLVAAVTRRATIAVAVLIGSNITNPLLAVGAGAILSGYSVPEAVVLFDAPVKIATAIMLYFFLAGRTRLSRMQCLTLIGLYVGYLLARAQLFPADVALG